MGRLLSFVLALWLVPAAAVAQGRTVVLRLDASLVDLADEIGRALERRTDHEVRVDAVLDDGTPRDLGDAIGIARAGDRIRIFATAPSRALHVTEIGAATDPRARARVIAVALTSFVETLDADIALQADPETPPPAPVYETYELPLDGNALDDLAPPFRPIDLTPHLMLEVRERVGYATQRDFGAPWTGISAGVCFGTWWCLVLDADLMAPREDHASDRGALDYQAGVIGIGGRFLPVEAGPVRFGVGIDATARIAHFGAPGPTPMDPRYSDWTASGGMRLLFDLSVQVAEVFAIALEGGGDIAFNAVRYARAGARVFPEDVVDLWAALALRFRTL